MQQQIINKYGVFDHGWYEFQLIYWWICLVSAKFGCQILLQGISDGTNMVIYDVITFEKSEKRLLWFSFTFCIVIKMFLCLLKWLKITGMYVRKKLRKYELSSKGKWILQRKEEFMHFRIKEKWMLRISGSKENLFQRMKLVDRWSFRSI